MRLLCLLLLFASLNSKAEVLDHMMASRISNDPFGYVWNQYAEAAEVLREQLNLHEAAKLTFSMNIKPGSFVQKFSVKVKFCTKNPPLKCLKDNFPTLTFNNSKEQLLIQELNLLNLKKETLVHLANMSKDNNLVIVTTVTEITAWHSFNKVLCEKVSDFNTTVRNQEVIELLPKEQNPFVQFQFQNKP